ncbi:MAG: DUF4124 domain-containing protein [Desulfobacteraceae bacterium]|nr:DUF4124 domain-containing protein [Desulfobacteraceae bacterium]
MIKTNIYVLIILFFSSFFYGNIYFWIDENGTKHYTNTTPPLNGTVEELEESNKVFQKITSKKNQKQPFKVLKVFDGDTIQVKGIDLVFKIRLVGIDSPEIGYKGQKSQPFSQKARQYLKGLVDDKKVTLKSYGTGGYNRQLAEVFVGNKNINLEMIKSGLAEVYKGKLSKKLAAQIYFQEELKAKHAGLGMWIQEKSYKSPKQWRKEHPRN